MWPILFRRITREFTSAETNATEKFEEDLELFYFFFKFYGEWTGEAEIRTRTKSWHWLSIIGYILTYSVLLRESIRQLWVLKEGTLIFLRPQCPITRSHLRQRETESCNIMNCSNNKTICVNGLFCHNKWVAKRQGHRNLEFHIVLIAHFIRTSTTDTNSNSSLADNLNCVLWWSRYPEITMW